MGGGKGSGFGVQGGHRRGGRRGVAGAVGAEGGGRSLHGLTRTDTDKHGRFLEVRIQVRVQRSGETENRENGVFGDNEKIENHQKQGKYAQNFQKFEKADFGVAF